MDGVDALLLEYVNSSVHLVTNPVLLFFLCHISFPIGSRSHRFDFLVIFFVVFLSAFTWFSTEGSRKSGCHLEDSKKKGQKRRISATHML